MARSSWLRHHDFGGENSPTAPQLERAFEILNYDFGYDEQRAEAVEFLRRFRQRWGGLSIDILAEIARRFVPTDDERMALGLDAVLKPKTSEEFDTRFVLAVLGVVRPSEAPSLLLPYLMSPRAQERWLAAFGLAAMHDEHALPAIEQILVEFVGPLQPWTSETRLIYIFQTLRHRLLRVLADWGDARIVPSIRAGLIATVRAEEIEVPEPQGPEQEYEWCGVRYTGLEAWKNFHNEMLFWVDEEHLFVYVLGRMGAFSALEGIPTRRGIYSWQYSWVEDGEGGYPHESGVPASHADGFRANVWRVHACFGALESQFRGQVGTIYTFSDAPELEKAVERLLAKEFGLDEVARLQAIEDYDRAWWVSWTRFKYAWETLPDQWDKTTEDDTAEVDPKDVYHDGEREPERDDSISLEDMEAQDFEW